MMPDTIFAKTRHRYDSYSDFWSLVELSGFQTCFVDEIDPSASAAYVYTPHTGEAAAIAALPRERRARIVWWNLERPEPDGAKPDLGAFRASVDRVLEHADAAWVSDRHYASLHPRLIHAVAGSHPGIPLAGERPPDAFDVCHMSYVNSRRNSPLQETSRGWRVGPNSWGQQRDSVLKSTKVMVNVHQTDTAVGEPLRFALAAAYGMAVASEHIVDPWPMVEGVHFASAPLGSLRRVVDSLLRDPQVRQRIGSSLRQLLTEEWTFRRGVEDAMSRTFS